MAWACVPKNARRYSPRGGAVLFRRISRNSGDQIRIAPQNHRGLKLVLLSAPQHPQANNQSCDRETWPRFGGDVHSTRSLSVIQTRTSIKALKRLFLDLRRHSIDSLQPRLTLVFTCDEKLPPSVVDFTVLYYRPRDRHDRQWCVQ